MAESSVRDAAATGFRRRHPPMHCSLPAGVNILGSRACLRAKRSLLILVAGHLAALACAAIPAQAETLSEAMASAYSTNPSLLAARKELSRADEQVAQSWGVYRPQAAMVAGGGYIKDLSGQQKSTAQSQFSSTDGPTAVLNLQVKQPIYNFSNAPRVRQAEELVRAERAHLVAVEQDVLLRAAQAYLDLVGAEASLRYSIDYENSLEKSLASTRRKFELGLVRNSSIAEAESRLAAASAQRIQAEGVVASARGNYAQVIGTEPGDLAMPEMPSGIPGGVDQVIAASADNPNIAAAEYARKAAEEGVDVSFGQKLPDFSLQGQLNPGSASLLGVMSMPLYDGMLDPQLRASKDLVGQRRLETEAARRLVRQTALSAWQNLQASQGRIRSFEAQVNAARIAVEGTTREYEFGLRPVSDLLDNQLAYFRSQVDLFSAQRELRLAAFQVLSAIGRMTADDLRLNVRKYDVDKHYEKVRSEWWGTGPDLE
jgi:outer membrane protein